MAREERDYSHRSLIDKLGVKREHRICLRGSFPHQFVQEISAEVEHPPATSARGRYDLIFLKVDMRPDLQTIASLAEHLEPAGSLWIVHPKGKGASPTDGEVRAAGLGAGLVDNKICAFNETHTATRYVIRRLRR